MSGVAIEETKKELDREWLALILEARNLGISVEEIREFLTKSN